MPRLFAAACAVLFAAGCATLEAPFSGHLESAAAPVRECAGWLRMLDERVEESGVRDAQEARVRGFPYLRVNRLLAALRPVAGGAPDEAGGAALHALADRMLALDLEARRYEIMNLPAGTIEGMRDASDGAGLRAALSRTQHCSRLLREIDLAKPELRRALLERAAVPDDYSLLNRIFGIYPLTRLAVAA